MKITLIAGDITTFSGDAIVNAANNAGLGGGGVDGAIHRAAGPRLLTACEALPIFEGLEGHAPGLEPASEVRVPMGVAVPTLAFDLPCKWVIHTAGPVWPSSEDDPVYVAHMAALAGMQLKAGAIHDMAGNVARRVLRSCYKMPLLTAVGMGLKSIAYPAISTGVYGCPAVTCAEVALKFARNYIDWPIDVSFYLHPASNLEVWESMTEWLGVSVTVIR